MDEISTHKRKRSSTRRYQLHPSQTNIGPPSTFSNVSGSVLSSSAVHRPAIEVVGVCDLVAAGV